MVEGSFEEHCQGQLSGVKEDIFQKLSTEDLGSNSLLCSLQNVAYLIYAVHRDTAHSPNVFLIKFEVNNQN